MDSTPKHAEKSDPLVRAIESVPGGREQAVHELRLRLNCQFVTDDEHYAHALDSARAVMADALYGEARGLVRSLRLALYDYDAGRAHELLNRLETHLS